MATNITSIESNALRTFGQIPMGENVYTAGQVETRISQMEDTLADAVGATLSSVWKAGGAKDGSELTAALLVAENEGKVYHLTSDATTSSNWLEGAGRTEEDPSFKFNALGVGDSSSVKSVGGVLPNASGDIPVSGEYEDGIYISGEGKIRIGALRGSSENRGTVYLSDDISGTEGTSYGVAATPRAVSGALSGAKGYADGLVSGIKNFAKVAVYGTSGTEGHTDVTPNDNADTLELKAGENITLSASSSGKSVTISATVPDVNVPYLKEIYGDRTNTDPTRGAITEIVFSGSGGISVAVENGVSSGVVKAMIGVSGFLTDVLIGDSCGASIVPGCGTEAVIPYGSEYTCGGGGFGVVALMDEADENVTTSSGVAATPAAVATRIAKASVKSGLDNPPAMLTLPTNADDLTLYQILGALYYGATENN